MSKARLLIVDDERCNITVLIEIFANKYDIVVAKNGIQAIERIEQKLPDLILLDIIMPEIDGYLVFNQIRALPQGRRIPIIFITGMRSAVEETKGLQMGAVDYITKPFTASIVAVRVANQIEAKQNRDILKRLNVTDPLTGIANRRHFDEYINLQLDTAKRSKSSLSLIMIDIDHFKPFNDHYGHCAGDDCLKTVAMAMSSCMERKLDVIARYGGEEFAVILPTTDQQGAEHCAQSLCETVSQLAIPHSYSTSAKVVTVSLGIATVCCARQNISVVDLICLADNALYRAKESGRNQYQCHVQYCK